MGTGKTTIGRKLAKRLGYHFIDMDTQIEFEQGCNISDLFEYGGEECFRRLETELLKRLASVRNTVISTGGGIVTTEGNIDLMKKMGKVIYLKSSVEDIIERTREDRRRPLLKVETDPEIKIRSLMEERDPLYTQANVVIETESSSPYRITSEIISNL